MPVFGIEIPTADVELNIKSVPFITARQRDEMEPNNKKLNTVCVFCRCHTISWMLFVDISGGLYGACVKCYEKNVAGHLCKTSQQYDGV